MDKSSLFDLLCDLPENVFYNCRVKSKALPDGTLVPFEVMYCNRFIFNPNGSKLSAFSRKLDDLIAYREAAAELFLGALPKSGGYIPAKTSEKEKLERSKRRAKSKLYDLILVNDFDCFVTLTLDNEKIDRYDYNAVIKKLNTYLDNRVRRQGLRYVGVPERHKDGALHFHFLCNSEALSLVDSGCVSCVGRKRPVKVATADRLKIPLSDRHVVYNISDWSLGYTTAVMTYGSTAAVANYIGKYVTKGEAKVGGRWYYSGGDLSRPVLSYDRVSFNDVDIFSYAFECSGGSFKVLKVDNEVQH